MTILSNHEVRVICLANGFKTKEQADGAMDLNPYVFSAANALVEAALAKTLVVSRPGIHEVLKRSPSSVLTYGDYNKPCAQYVEDFARLERLCDALQASIVSRQINSTKLWNVVVVDKHSAPLAGSLNVPLGVAMGSLTAEIGILVAEAQRVPNEPFFKEPVFTDMRHFTVELNELTQMARLAQTEIKINNHLPDDKFTVTVAGDDVKGVSVCDTINRAIAIVKIRLGYRDPNALIGVIAETCRRRGYGLVVSEANPPVSTYRIDVNGVSVQCIGGELETQRAALLVANLANFDFVANGECEQKPIEGLGKYFITPVIDDDSGHHKAWWEIVQIAESLDIPVKYTKGPQTSVVHVSDITLTGPTAHVLAATQAVLIRSIKC
ncbi:hypothetical protein pEaSNUABM54_00166 [Erwinia phage pEa_SNUABM_54]|nr:hypothetical protein pEaSNUABM54_00166 [Erwinia phage pEa_SNUABM_54]